MCSLLLIVTVKNLLIKMFGRKAAEEAMEGRCMMSDAVNHILHQVRLAFSFWRLPGFNAESILPVTWLWHVLRFCCMGSVSSRPAVSGDRIAESLLCVKDGPTSK